MNISIQFLRECFDADFESGHLVWRARPDAHFSSASAAKSWRAKFSGRVAGGPHKEGYMVVYVRFDGRRHGLLVHRILWAMRNGAWPTETIDHKNCVRTDNREINLRVSGYADQNANRAVSNRSKVGLKGVCVCTTTGRFKAQLHRDGKNHHLGRFDTAEEAHSAYIEAARKIHGEFAKW